MKRQAEATVQIDDARVRVTRYDFPPGSETGHHVHPLDYVVVPVVPGRLTMVDDDGIANQAVLELGHSYRRTAGVSHNVINETDAPVAFVEIELKG